MTHGSKSPVRFVVIGVVVWAVLVSAGPTLIALAEAAVPLIIVVGVVLVVLRLVYARTQKW